MNDNTARVEKIKAEQAEAWKQQRALDNALMEGINQGETFGEFLRRTRCPGWLEGRYIELQQASGIAPGSKKKERDQAEAFLRGFMRG